MTFSDDLARFQAKVAKRERDIFNGVTVEVHRSVVEGSEITGAPGQPVDIGTLHDSWTPDFVTPTLWQTTTHLNYAPIVEDNVRGVTFKNHGPHSVKMTRVAFPLIVEAVTRRVGN